MFTRRASAKSAVRTLVALGALGILAGLLDARPGAFAPGDLEGRWRLDEGTGTSAADSSGNGNTGTLMNGPAWVAGQAGQALSFDGVNDHVTLGTASLPAANASQTISWWMNYASVPSGVGTAIDLHNDASSSGIQTGFRSGKVTVWKHGGGVLVDAQAPSSNFWHHFAYTFDGTTHRLYVNGTQSSTSTVTPQTATPTSATLGRWNGGAAEYYAGKLDEVRVYSRTLGADEITGLAHGGALEAWWKMDEGSGTLAADTSGGDYDGILTNGATWGTGKIGPGAVSLDGVNDYVNLGSSLRILNKAKGVTLAGWVNLTSVPASGAFRELVAISVNAGAPTNTSRAALAIVGDGTAADLFTGFRSTDTESQKNLTAASANLGTGTWVHVAGVTDLGAGTIKIYVNGVQSASTTVTYAQGEMPDTVSTSNALGAQDKGDSNFFAGLLDDVRVYSRALTADEIAGLAGGTGTGLSAVYYDNIDWTGTFIQRTDAQINFNWGTGSPDPAIGADTFSAVWTGQVQPQFSELYTFYTNTDDGVRLWVNGQLIVDFPQDQAPTERTGQIVLTGGTKYNLRMEYFENGGGAVAELRWSSASTAKAIIPQSQLYPTDTVSPTITGATSSSGDLTKVYVRFTEAMDKTTSETTANWTLSGGLSVNAAALSSDKRVVTVTASGNVTLGTTTVTASASILGITRESLASPFTHTVVAGSSLGFPDSTAITLALGTDGAGKSTIQQTGNTAFDIPDQGLRVALTVTAPGTAAKTVELSQMKEPGGKSEIFFGLTGNDTSATVTTSGGSPNQATIKARAKTTGAFEKDFRIVASGSPVIGLKSATVTSVSTNPPCIYLADQRPVKQTATVTPVIQGLQLVTETFLVTRTGHASQTTLLASPAWALTDSQGKATRAFQAATEFYAGMTVVTQGSEGRNVLTDSKDT